MDAQVDPQVVWGPAPARAAHRPWHLGPPAQGAALLAADQPQAPGGDGRPRPGPAVPLPGPGAALVSDAGPARDQRECQEEGVDRAVKESRPGRRHSSREVLDHDFPSWALGRGIPYGIYDVGRNGGTWWSAPRTRRRPSR